MKKINGVKAEWHFLASCHGKGACDGIGGTVKRMATKASLQRPHNPILNAIDLYNFAKEFIKGVDIFYVGASVVEIATRQLIHRYETAKTISGTRSNHSFVPINSTQLLISRVSNSLTSFIATMGSERESLILEKEKYVACVYCNKWWIGKV